MTYRAVDRHNMMGGRGFRVEELKIRTFIFRFLGLVNTLYATYLRIGNINTDDKVWSTSKHPVCYLSPYWQYKYGWQSVEHHEMTAINCGGRVVPSATLSPLLVPIARPLLILPLTRATSRHFQPCNIEYAREENYYLYWIWKQLSPIYLNLNQSYRRIDIKILNF